MNKSISSKMKLLDSRAPEVREKLEEFAKQVDTTRALFGECQVHPGLHAFMVMEGLRRDMHFALNSIVKEDRPIYAPGSEQDLLVDSIFDEAIDDIVENGFQKGCMEGKSTTKTLY
jgi:hypothetical protein